MYSGFCTDCGNWCVLSYVKKRLCATCGSRRKDTCVKCGRFTYGHNTDRGRGGFHCQPCSPKRTKPCSRCGQQAPPVVNWPQGPVCASCYHRVLKNPGHCISCVNLRVLVVEGDAGGTCGPCVNSEFTYLCSRCERGHPYRANICRHCAAAERIDDVLSHEGVMHPQLQRFADTLKQVENPLAVIAWLSRPATAEALSVLVNSAEISHQLLDSLDQTNTVHQLRHRLVACDILPERTEFLDRAEVWLNGFLDELPGHHRKVLQPFTKWHLLNRARRRIHQGNDNHKSGEHLRQHIRIVAEFLTWIDQHELILDSLTQSDIEAWILGGPHTSRYKVRAFVDWAKRRRLIRRDLTIPPTPMGQSRIDPLDDDEAFQHLERCLNDEQLPIIARAAGALILLYGFNATQLASLAADDAVEHDDQVSLKVAQTPILLPPGLADLVLQLKRTPPDRSQVSRAVGPTKYLFPGGAAGRPIRPPSLRKILNRSGIPATRGRDAALLALARDLPSPILAQMLGLSTATVEVWASVATRDWTHYLQARIEDLAPPAQPARTSQRND